MTSVMARNLPSPVPSSQGTVSMWHDVLLAKVRAELTKTSITESKQVKHTFYFLKIDFIEIKIC